MHNENTTTKKNISCVFWAFHHQCFLYAGSYIKHIYIFFLVSIPQMTSKFAVLFITVQYNVTISTNGKLGIGLTA